MWADISSREDDRSGEATPPRGWRLETTDTGWVLIVDWPSSMPPWWVVGFRRQSKLFGLIAAGVIWLLGSLRWIGLWAMNHWMPVLAVSLVLVVCTYVLGRTIPTPESRAVSVPPGGQFARLENGRLTAADGEFEPSVLSSLHAERIGGGRSIVAFKGDHVSHALLVEWPGVSEQEAGALIEAVQSHSATLLAGRR